MKHVAIDFHFIQDQVQKGSLQVTHVSSADQLADALAKPLARARFLDLKSKIGVLSQAPSCGGILETHQQMIVTELTCSISHLIQICYSLVL